MDKFEDRIRLSTTTATVDEDFVLKVRARVDKNERRRATLLALATIVAAALFSALLFGLGRLGPLWAAISPQDWFALSPLALNIAGAIAPAACFLLVVALIAPLIHAQR